MGEKSAIEWTESTWNPVTGCSKVSPGCAHCYAESLSIRFGHSEKPWTPENAAMNVVLHEARLAQPLRWKRPRMIFVNSMSDLFHELVPFEFIARVYSTMRDASEHTFQVLTKRPERALEFSESSHWQGVLTNVWTGVSIENSRYSCRATTLRKIPSSVRFISAEPLLGSLFDSRGKHAPLELKLIDWVIAGGESGTHARPMNIAWARELRDACEAEGVAFFFKQWGGRTSKSGGRLLDDRMHDAMPVAGTNAHLSATA